MPPKGKEYELQKSERCFSNMTEEINLKHIFEDGFIIVDMYLYLFCVSD